MGIRHIKGLCCFYEQNCCLQISHSRFSVLWTEIIHSEAIKVQRNGFAYIHPILNYEKPTPLPQRLPPFLAMSWIFTHTNQMMNPSWGGLQLQFIYSMLAKCHYSLQSAGKQRSFYSRKSLTLHFSKRGMVQSISRGQENKDCKQIKSNSYSKALWKPSSQTRFKFFFQKEFKT